MYSKILVPVDGSDAATCGLAEAIKMAKEQGGRLRLLHIVKPPFLDYGYSKADLSRKQVIAVLYESGKRILSRAEALVREQGLNPECLMFESIDGPVATLILDQAKEWSADLIVLGTHPRGGLIGIGSDLAEVLSLSPVPVLLVRATQMSITTPEHRALEYPCAA
jgi:nucleotide-binding universal stress UspA family protein